MPQPRHSRNCVLKGLIRLFCLATLLSVASHADELEGRITRIIDGDTLLISDHLQHSRTIHLFGIDAPELVQDFGQASKAKLSALALNQSVHAHCVDQDRYGHDLCVVTLRGEDVGLMQIRNGMAWWNQKHVLRQPVPTRNLYQQAEFYAKIHRYGLWNSKNPTPPWDWRHGRLEE